MEDRKQRILRAVTDDYIQTAEPVGSRTIARKYLVGVSPATIRNEMADLEEQGYLEQPHASAGRIPSDRGYRYYVDQLMEVPPHDRSQVLELRRRFMAGGSVERAVRLAGRALIRYGRYSSLVFLPTLQRLRLRQVQLTPLDGEHVLLLVVAEPAFVYNRILDWAGSAPNAAELDRLSRLLTEVLYGLSGDVTRSLEEALSDILPWARVREQAIEALHELTHEREPDRAYVDGVSLFLEQPEFRKVEYAREVLEYLNDPDVLAEVLMHGQVDRLVVVIGQEQPVAPLRGCSAVLAPYGEGGRVLGVIGLIGPRRMDYSRAVAAVGRVAEALTEALEAMAGAAG